MRGLQIKVKTILILVVVAGVLMLMGYQLTPIWLASQARNHTYRDNAVSALIMQERLFKYFPQSDEARDGIFALADGIMQQEERVFIGPSFSGGGGGSGQPNMDIDKIKGYLYRISQLQGHSVWRYIGYHKMGNIYRYQGEWDQAWEYYDKAIRGFSELNNTFQVVEVNEDLVKMYMEKGEYQEALSIIDQNYNRFPSNQRGQFLVWKGDIFYELGEIEQAIEVYQAAMEAIRKEWDGMMASRRPGEQLIAAKLEEQPAYRHAKQRLNTLEHMDGSGVVEGSTIEGRIRRTGQPMANVKIYLISEKEYDGRGNHLENIVYKPPVITDEKGFFQFEQILPGRYLIVLGVMPEDLKGMGRVGGLETIDVSVGETLRLEYEFHNRIEIERPVGKHTLGENEELQLAWKPVDGAAYYTVHLSLAVDSGYISRPIAQSIEGTSYVFKREGIEARGFNFVMMDGDFVPQPSAILGSFYPGAEIYFSVEAHDQEGRTITDSEGYVMKRQDNYPWVEVGKQPVFTKADELVLDKKYPQAIEAYNEILSKEPDNPYALLSLARLYSTGWGIDTKDINRAAEYYGKLVNLQSEDFIMEEGASTFYEAEQYQKALALFEKIMERFPQNSFWFHLMGKMSLITGNPQKAVQYFETYLDSQKEFPDLGPVIARLYLGEVDKAIDLLESKGYSQRFRYSSSNGEGGQPSNVIKLKELLDRYQKGEKSQLEQKEFQQYLLEVISIKNPNRYEKIEDFQGKIKKLGKEDVLVQILIELSRDRY